MKILFLAPVPPPITGHSLVSKVLYDDLNRDMEIALVNLSKGGVSAGMGFFKRLLEVWSIIREIQRKKKKVDVIYFTISESLFGNLKDLLVYVICYGNLSKMYIHLHGGSIKRLLWDKYRLIHRWNNFFVRRMGGAIISGESHGNIFKDILPGNKISMVPNFALEGLFRSDQEIEQNFDNETLVNVLYMSGMKKKKGYEELLKAYQSLCEEEKSRIRIDFAGNFESDKLKSEFEEAVEKERNITFHGIVNEQEKQDLFARAHVFCLPTMFFEGQPISILEAYASGCIVLTTGQSGILDIFSNKKNGFEIDQDGLSRSISKHLKSLLTLSSQEKLRLGLNNAALARKKYRVSTYNSSLRKVMCLSQVD